MALRLKSLDNQVMVITGASSGIGLVTARLAAKRGARVLLVARSERALSRLVEDISAAGGEAAYAVADVANARDLVHAADVAVRQFGGIDTWVNNASSAIYGRLEEVELDDKRRLFDVNFWGVVHGCRAAVPRLRERGGGALINIGSVLSDRAIPLLGIYSAAKQAVKAYTDTLRMELEADGAPISVTLIKPSSIDTPFFEHARNYMQAAPVPVPPVYAPEVVAEAILACAQKPVRDLIVGGGGKVLSAVGAYAPRVMDKYMERTSFEQQQDDRPARGQRDSLFDASEDGVERGRYRGRVRQSSAYTTAALNPGVTLAALGAGLALLAGVRAMRARRAANGASVDGAAADDLLVADGASVDGGAAVADSAEAELHVPASGGRGHGSARGWRFPDGSAASDARS